MTLAHQDLQEARAALQSNMTEPGLSDLGAAAAAATTSANYVRSPAKPFMRDYLRMMSSSLTRRTPIEWASEWVMASMALFSRLSVSSVTMTCVF